MWDNIVLTSMKLFSLSQISEESTGVLSTHFLNFNLIFLLFFIFNFLSM